MLQQQDLLETISGRRMGLLATAIRLLLSSLTPVFRLAVAIRNWRFDRDAKLSDSRRIHRAEVPVISVGNLTTGGTGKTPLVIWIANYFQQSQQKVVILSRGYAGLIDRVPTLASSPQTTAEADSLKTNSQPTSQTTKSNDFPISPPIQNDEAIEIEARLPGVLHLQHPDRVRSAQLAVSEHAADVILLDDGFQHRRLHRDLDIVVIDAICPFGYGRLLPRGLLREPIGNLRRADVIVLNRCDQVSETERKSVLQKLQIANPRALLLQSKIAPVGWIQFSKQAEPRSLDSLSRFPHRTVAMFCGIGNPAGFRQTIRDLNLSIANETVFPDHHHFSDIDLQRMVDAARAAGAEAMVCTHKDLVKISRDEIAGLPLFALQVGLAWVSGETKLRAKFNLLSKTNGTGR